MQFIKHDLGMLSSGALVEITISDAAYVRLLDSHNFLMYRSGRRFKQTGGRYENSPVRFEIPQTDRWYVAVDLAGYPGAVESSARVLSEDLHPIQEVI